MNNMGRFSSPVQVPVPSPRTLPAQAIYWGCVPDGDPERFPPDISALHQRRGLSSPLPLSHFVEAVKQAKNRVWIMDSHFLSSPSDKIKQDDYVLDIAGWFHPRIDATDIRILTCHDPGFGASQRSIFDVLVGDINQRRASGQTKFSLVIREKMDNDLIHDRFAIIDDELWHFGATVGGFHTSLSAVSRGWCAIETGAADFFNLAWKVMV
ncbi:MULTISPECIES: hypothetical protein [unclassified Citrobacter]|uniref:hypothetical protein n=1 Tax=unclassified Citrobacter TaxID=2644389 RepID=UPI002302A236|nr:MULTISPECIES: hypothetical protein [unclassified Citrobacter]MDA8500449.1 hypothetical protein [Citrobacter sp. Igbk 17]MDA8516502.1 hypothetical protein [Citrobacter sp. Igbk 16]